MGKRYFGRRDRDDEEDEERRERLYRSPWDRFYSDFWERSFYDDFFRDLEEEFIRMRRSMEDAFESAMRCELPSPEEGGPYVYGFSMRVGPDGKPHIQEFGNVPSMGGFARHELPEGREPLTDIIESDDVISVTAEMPGVERNDIDLTVTEDTLTIKVDREQRKYYKEITLPCDVDSENVKASYRNGILDVTLNKKKPKKVSKKVNIE